MSNTTILRRRLKIGFALVLLLAGLVSFVSFVSLRAVIDAKDDVIQDYAQDVVQMRDLEVASAQVAASCRAYLLTHDDSYLRQGERARAVYRERIDQLRATADFPGEKELLDGAMKAAVVHEQALDEAIAAKRKAATPKEIAEMFEAGIQPRSQELRDALQHLVTEKDRLAGRALQRARRSALRATILVAVLGGSDAALAAGLFLLSLRTLRRLESSEREVHSLNETLERRVAARTREIEIFAYTIAHDLRAPLRTMAGMSDLILSDPGNTLDADGRDALGRIKGAAIRMDGLINGLLGLARLSYQPFPLTSVDLEEVVGTVLASLDPEIRAAGAKVEVDVPPVRALAHPLLVSIALAPLISNGLKFVAPGVKPWVKISAERANGRVRLMVTDNGIGIDARYHQRIFGMFQRLHPNESYPGIGAGLAMAQRAAERMGGTVGLDSRPEAGSTFWIELAAERQSGIGSAPPAEPIPASR